MEELVQVADRADDVREEGPGLQSAGFRTASRVGATSGEHEVGESEWVVVEVDGHGEIAEEDKVAKALVLAVCHRPGL